MSDFEEDMTVDISEYLSHQRDSGIKNILNLLDMSDLNSVQKKKIRKAVLDEMNNLHLSSCRVLTCVQEGKNG